jgi:hypothetical protein
MYLMRDLPWKRHYLRVVSKVLLRTLSVRCTPYVSIHGDFNEASLPVLPD